MKLIRKSVFETNSSSCHSISVGSSDVYQGLSPDSMGIITIEPMEFGWEQETYYCVNARLAYVWLFIRDWSGDKMEERKKMFEEVIFEHTCATSIEYPNNNPDDWSLTGGYIDHQSVESDDLGFLFDDKKLLKNFLFNKDSFIQTNNDN